MYVTMDSILQDAHKNYYGVMSVNSINIEMARAVISAAEELRSPIIIQIGPGQMAKHADPLLMAPVVKILAEQAKVPVALNLDHGAELDQIISCIQKGFSNVMIDASSCEFEENVKRSATIVKLAHAKGISVEAELGHVGQAVSGDGRSDDMYTNVAQAKEFVDRTGVDALAVAIGTAHGQYPKGYVPVLDFERLKELKETLNMPLVLHGGSGSGEENLRKAVANGINKINVCTDAFQAGKDAMADLLEKDPKADFLAMQMAAEAGIKTFVKDYIKVIGSNNRYYFGASTAEVHE